MQPTSGAPPVRERRRRPWTTWTFVISVSAFFCAPATALVIFFAIRDRRRHADEVGAPIHGSLALELIRTAFRSPPRDGDVGAGSSVDFATLRGRSASSRCSTSSPSARSGCGSSSTARGSGKINALHVPGEHAGPAHHHLRGRPRRPTSPHVRRQTDAIAAYTPNWFNATQLGTFHLFCAEYRGTKVSWARPSAAIGSMPQEAGPGLARRRRGRGHAGERRRAPVHAARLRDLPRLATSAARC